MFIPLFAFREYILYPIVLSRVFRCFFHLLVSFVCFLRLLHASLCPDGFLDLCRYHSGCVTLASCSWFIVVLVSFVISFGSPSLVCIFLFQVFYSPVMFRYGLMVVTFPYYSLRLFSRWSLQAALPRLLRLVTLRCSVSFSLLRLFRCVWVSMWLFRGSGYPFRYSVILSRSPPSAISG